MCHFFFLIFSIFKFHVSEVNFPNRRVKSKSVAIYFYRRFRLITCFDHFFSRNRNTILTQFFIRKKILFDKKPKYILTFVASAEYFDLFLEGVWLVRWLGVELGNFITLVIFWSISPNSTKRFFFYIKGELREAVGVTGMLSLLHPVKWVWCCRRLRRKKNWTKLSVIWIIFTKRRLSKIRSDQQLDHEFWTFGKKLTWDPPWTRPGIFWA